MENKLKNKISLKVIQSPELGQQLETQLTSNQQNSLKKQGYRLVGNHSAVKICEWTRNMIRGKGGCYKFIFYGIRSHQCLQMTTSMFCASRCKFCWRGQKAPVASEWYGPIDSPEHIINHSIDEHIKLLQGFKGMGFEKHNKKAISEKSQKIPELPKLPPLPKLPELPKLETFRDDDFTLPALPENNFGGEERGEEVFDEMKFEKQQDEFQEIQKPLEILSSRIPSRNKVMHEEKISPAISEKSLGAGPVFIRLDKFEESLESFEKIWNSQARSNN